MWIKTDFGTDINAEITYSYDDDNFSVSCTFDKTLISDNSKLYVYSYFSERENELPIGTLSVSFDKYTLSKSYTRSYVSSHKIDCSAISHFSVVSPDGRIYKAYCVKDKFDAAPEDSAITNAREKLMSLKNGRMDAEGEKRAISNIAGRLANYDRSSDKISDGYTWYEISDIKENFNLSSIKHLIYCRGFMNGFVKFGKWYFGISPDEHLYAVAVRNLNDNGIVFENASDCVCIFGSDEIKYSAVGIGLFEDGQYFYKIE